MNKSSSLLLHLHLLHFLIMNRSSYFKKEKRKKKKKTKDKIFKKKKGKKEEGNSKKALGLGALGSYFLGCSKKKKKKIINQNFQFLQKIQVFQIHLKKKNLH